MPVSCSRVSAAPPAPIKINLANPEVVNHHLAKVYGQAEVGAPPMSVPHIDTRIIDGKRYLSASPG
jgi:L-2-hydroxyglutarate oxidase LhgO